MLQASFASFGKNTDPTFLGRVLAKMLLVPLREHSVGNAQVAEVDLVAKKFKNESSLTVDSKGGKVSTNAVVNTVVEVEDCFGMIALNSSC